MYNILKIFAIFVVGPTYNLTKYPFKLHIKSHKTINEFGAVCFYNFVNFCKVSILTKTCKLGGYWWLFYWWLLMAILLMASGGFSINA
jgi:hypothetical protein